MLHSARLLAVVLFLGPLVCQGQSCKAEGSHDDETSLVQVKASVTIGSEHGSNYRHNDGPPRLSAFAGSRRRFTATSNLESLINQAEARPGLFNGPTRGGSSRSFTSGNNRASQTMTHGRPKMDHMSHSMGGSRNRPRAAQPQVSVTQPSQDFAAMLGGKTAEMDTTARSSAISDSSDLMMSRSDKEAIGHEMAKNKALIDKDLAERNAYASEVAKEKADYDKYQQDQMDWYNNRTAAQKKWYDDGKAASKAYVEKQEMGLRAYTEAQQQVMKMMADAKQQVMDMR